MGNKIGKETLFKYIKNFGFGSKTGIDLNGEGSGILFNINKVGPVELATTSFGQGVSVTPLQQITAVSSIVNGGNLYKPYIMKSILDSKTNNVYLVDAKIDTCDDVYDMTFELRPHTESNINPVSKVDETFPNNVGVLNGLNTINYN